MANAMYNSLKATLGTINWADNATTDIRVMLVDASYVPDIDTHAFISDVTGEVVGTAYVAGGELLLTRAVTIDTVNDWAKYDGDDVTWVASTIVARGAVVYKDTGVPTTSPLISYLDFVSDKSSTAGDFVVKWHVDGVFRIA
jgi:hypothetical protein